MEMQRVHTKDSGGGVYQYVLPFTDTHTLEMLRVHVKDYEDNTYKYMLPFTDTLHTLVGALEAEKHRRVIMLSYKGAPADLNTLISEVADFVSGGNNPNFKVLWAT